MRESRRARVAVVFDDLELCEPRGRMAPIPMESRPSRCARSFPVATHHGVYPRSIASILKPRVFRGGFLRQYRLGIRRGSGAGASTGMKYFSFGGPISSVASLPARCDQDCPAPPRLTPASSHARASPFSVLQTQDRSGGGGRAAGLHQRQQRGDSYEERGDNQDHRKARRPQPLAG